MKEVDVTISRDGMKVEMDAKNFDGSSCKDFLGSIMRELGTVETEKKKPEYYNVAGQKVRA